MIKVHHRYQRSNSTRFNRLGDKGQQQSRRSSTHRHAGWPNSNVSISTVQSNPTGESLQS